MKDVLCHGLNGAGLEPPSVVAGPRTKIERGLRPGTAESEDDVASHREYRRAGMGSTEASKLLKIVTSSTRSVPPEPKVLVGLAGLVDVAVKRK